MKQKLIKSLKSKDNSQILISMQICLIGTILPLQHLNFKLS